MPHLKRALQLHLQFSRLRLNAEGSASGLDAFGHAVFGLNQLGHVVLSNRSAQQIITSGRDLSLANDHLDAADPHASKKLQTGIAQALATGTMTGSPPTTPFS